MVLLHFVVEIGDVQAGHLGRLGNVAVGSAQAIAEIICFELLDVALFGHLEGKPLAIVADLMAVNMHRQMARLDYMLFSQ